MLQKGDKEIRKPRDIRIVKATSKYRVVTFTAYDLRTQTATNLGDDIGYIKYTPSSKKLEVVNRDVFLERTDLLMGKTSKRNGENTIGVHGEGMKIGE